MMNIREQKDSPAALLKEAINIHGELHLDRERAAALLSLIIVVEEYYDELEEQLRSLVEAIKPIVGPDEYKYLKMLAEKHGLN